MKVRSSTRHSIVNRREESKRACLFIKVKWPRMKRKSMVGVLVSEERFADLTLNVSKIPNKMQGRGL